MGRAIAMTPISVLDLAPVPLGSTPADALRNTLDLARHAEHWGYTRYWLAEHHNMVGIASAATAVVIGYVAAGTTHIRVGAGGIMLPNHAPLIIAEQFGTLETLYPGRIDLGVGRAPGTDQRTLRALRRDPTSADTFPQDVLELQALLGPLQPGQVVQAVPGTGLQVPLWILGSSLYGAQLAAMLGLPYAFASHFAPEALMPALQVYRERFEPSRQLERAYAMVGVNVIAADSDAEARRLAITHIFPCSINGLLASLKGVSFCAEPFEGPPFRVILSGSNIDRGRNYNCPCGWSKMWVIARASSYYKALHRADHDTEVPCQIWSGLHCGRR